MGEACGPRGLSESGSLEGRRGLGIQVIGELATCNATGPDEATQGASAEEEVSPGLHVVRGRGGAQQEMEKERPMTQPENQGALAPWQAAEGAPWRE